MEINKDKASGSKEHHVDGKVRKDHFRVNAFVYFLVVGFQNDCGEAGAWTQDNHEDVDAINPILLLPKQIVILLLQGLSGDPLILSIEII